jgi:hypothetical protein
MKMLFSMIAAVAVTAQAAEIQQAAVAPEPGQLKVQYFGAYSDLPVGAVQPRGWIQKWLERQAQGLTGHPENMSYPYDTCMYAGVIPAPTFHNKWFSEWWPYEQTGYFVDATTRLSWLINDPAITERRDANLNYILAHSYGTNYGASHWCWPNAVVGRALMAEFSATDDLRVATTMENWLRTSAEQIKAGGRNGANFEEAFYLYGLTGDKELLELCRAIYNGYLTATNSFCTAEKIEGKAQFHEHGVTAAETLKCFPLMYSYTGDAEALRLARLAYQKVLDHNLMADGGIVSSEHMEPTAFYSVHEGCDITDWSWSFGYMFMATGDSRYADLIERTTFNALPGAVTKDFKQLQYFSAVNQTVIGPTNSHTPRWPTRMTYRAAHDTECCAGNINRAMPNYVNRMWMHSGTKAIAAVYYGPSEATVQLKGQKVVISEETDYPFRDSISFKIKTMKPVTFDLRLRIPGWCENPQLRVNGKEWSEKLKAGTFASVHREFRDGDLVMLTLPMSVRVERWLGGKSVCFTRGPLVFSLDIEEKRVEHTNDSEDIKPFELGHEIQGFPEVEFAPKSDWRLGFDPGIENSSKAYRVVETGMTDNPFVKEQTPVRLEVPLYHLPEWKEKMPGEPVGLPAGAEGIVSGAPRESVLVPYGATYLRLTTLPIVRTE